VQNFCSQFLLDIQIVFSQAMVLMKLGPVFLVVAFFCVAHVPAATLYVNLLSTNPVSPYASWSTAATSIQDAVNASSAGDLILVTNGDYQNGGQTNGGNISATNRVAVTNAETIQSVNGPAVTLIDGISSMRCVYLNSGAQLIGFTLTNGYVPGGNGVGGGACGVDSSAVFSNCVVTSCYAYIGGGVTAGTFYNCILVKNVAEYGGGANGGTLYNCLVMGNSGDGVEGGTADNCVITENAADFAAAGGAHSATLNNCLVFDNSGGGTESGTLNNCTVAYNNPYGVETGSFNNTIIYGNGNENYNGAAPFTSYFTDCDITPLPSQHAKVSNVITNAPLFVGTNDFHLQSNSPCINSGNNAPVVGATDLDGNPRIVGGTVDIGAYEYQMPVSQISYAWLEQYGLPISANTDTTDVDGSAFDVYQDWIAGLNPTNPASVLAMLPSTPTNNPSGLVVNWDSVPGITYFIQSSTNLAQPAFSTIRSNIVGQANVTSFMDTNAVGNGPFFYRVGVQ
jgi:hypothetical protein